MTLVHLLSGPSMMDAIFTIDSGWGGVGYGVGRRHSQDAADEEDGCDDHAPHVNLCMYSLVDHSGSLLE